jgi:hypothetical protein
MNCTVVNIRMDKEIPPYLEIKSATTRGPAAKPSFNGIGKPGTIKGIEPTITPINKPPKSDKKSGSRSFFS